MTTYISIQPVFASEKDGYVDFLISLSAASAEQVSVYYSTDAMTASSSTDYVYASGTLVFSPGVTAQTVRVALKDDLVTESLESFALRLSNATNAVIANPSGHATIADNDAMADISHMAGLWVRDAVVDAGAGSVTFDVVLDRAVGSSVSVAYGTANGSASAGSDYVAANGSLTFGAGETVKHVTVTLPRDSAAEPSEMFSLELGAVSGAGASVVNVTDGVGYATIGAHGQTVKAMPAISVGNLTVGEKDGYAEFVVSLNAPSANQVSVYYTTDYMSATATGDYDATSGTLVFAPGVTTQTVRVAIVNDLATETLENFGVVLSSAANAVIANRTAIATIVDNDTIADNSRIAGVSVRDVTVDATADTATFNVVLDKAVDKPFTVAYTTTDGNAVAGSDYIAVSGMLTFGAGQTAKSVMVTLPHDVVAEPDELFNLALGAISGSGASHVVVTDGIGQATIGAHGQTEKAMPAINVSNPFVSERDGYVDFIVSLDAPSANQVSVYYVTDALTASSSSDFSGSSGTLVFAPGVTTQTVRVNVTDDLKVEALENVALVLSNANNGVIANRAGFATIVDNDTMADSSHIAGLWVRDVTVDASADTATFNVVLDKALNTSFSVGYSTARGSAVAGSDYLAASGTLTFAFGETMKSVTVALPHGDVAEAVEGFSLLLGDITGKGAGQVMVARGAGHATIGAHGPSANGAPVISISDGKVGEIDGYAEFVVSLSAPTASQVSVYYVTDSGTARSGSDFEYASGTLVFAPGVTTQVVRVAIGSDSAEESLESFSLALSGATNATIGKPSATMAIVDNSSYSMVTGGAGLDTVAYAGARGNYTIASTSGGFTVSTPGGAIDQLINVERLSFADVSVALDVNGAAGQAYRIYQAAFNRTPDAGGLGYWIDAIDKGATLAQVASSFMQSQEFLQMYGANPGAADLVSKFYQNVLHRAGEPAGVAYWMDILESRQATPAQVLAYFSDGPENQAALANVIGNGFAYTPYLG